MGRELVRLRLAEAGVKAMDDVAAEVGKQTGTTPTQADVHRAALIIAFNVPTNRALIINRLKADQLA